MTLFSLMALWLAQVVTQGAVAYRRKPVYSIAVYHVYICFLRRLVTVFASDLSHISTLTSLLFRS
jgi:hypothetical protein